MGEENEDKIQSENQKNIDEQNAVNEKIANDFIFENKNENVQQNNQQNTNEQNNLNDEVSKDVIIENNEQKIETDNPIVTETETKLNGEQEIEETKQREEHKKTKKKSFFKKAPTNQTEEIEKLKISINELTDKMLRNAAEFDNYKKRTLKEKSDLLKYGSETVLLNLLHIVDDFERANKSINESTDIEAVKTGVNLIYSKFNEFLIQQGLKEIVAVNQEFNTDLHEAVTRFPASTEDLKGKIIDVVQKGYTLNEKVIRFAKVVVGE